MNNFSRMHYFFYCSLLSFMAIFLLCSGSIAGDQKESLIANDMSEYFSEWIGVKAPEFSPPIQDRITGPQILLSNFRGKRILLYSFNAGDFVNVPNNEYLLAELRALERVRSTSARYLVVIGFTYGADFFLPGNNLGTDVKKLTCFPIVNLNNKRGDYDLPLPYNLLHAPSSIVIDQNGIIIAIYPQPMTEAVFQQVASIKDWAGHDNLPPKEMMPDSIKQFINLRGRIGVK